MIASRLEWRLKQFVDRDREMARFCAFLDSGDKLVTAVHGPAGIGKSSLKERMIHECSLRKVSRVEIVYMDDDLPEYMAIMRRCRDDLGVEHFSSLTTLINYYTDPKYKIEISGNVRVGEGMQIADGATVGNVTGVVITDSMFVFPRSDLDVSEAERRAKLTDTFLTDLCCVARRGTQIVIFIDGAEKMSEGTARWVWDSVITGLAEAGIANVRVVFFGRQEPKIDGWTQELVDLTPLAPLDVPDIQLYMEKRGIPPDLAVAELVWANSDGNPLEISHQVDMLIRVQKRRQGAA